MAALELAAQSLQAALEGHQLQAAAGGERAAAARAALLHMMQVGDRLPLRAVACVPLELCQPTAPSPPPLSPQTAAHMVSLPGLAASIGQELPGGSSTQPGSGAAAAPLQPQGPARQQQARQQQQQGRRQVCPASPSEAGSQGYATPSGSIAGGGDTSSEDDGSSSGGSEGGSPRADGGGEITTRPDPLTAGNVGDAGVGGLQQQQLNRGPLLPKLQLGGSEEPAGGRPSSAGGPPSSRIPGVCLVSPPAPPAECGDSPCHRLSPQVLARLHSISNKLEAALADAALDVEAV